MVLWLFQLGLYFLPKCRSTRFRIQNTRWITVKSNLKTNSGGNLPILSHCLQKISFSLRLLPTSQTIQMARSLASFLARRLTVSGWTGAVPAFGPPLPCDDLWAKILFALLTGVVVDFVNVNLFVAPVLGEGLANRLFADFLHSGTGDLEDFWDLLLSPDADLSCSLAGCFLLLFPSSWTGEGVGPDFRVTRGAGEVPATPVVFRASDGLDEDVSDPAAGWPTGAAGGGAIRLPATADDVAAGFSCFSVTTKALGFFWLSPASLFTTVAGSGFGEAATFLPVSVLTTAAAAAVLVECLSCVGVLSAQLSWLDFFWPDLVTVSVGFFFNGMSGVVDLSTAFLAVGSWDPLRVVGSKDDSRAGFFHPPIPFRWGIASTWSAATARKRYKIKLNDYRYHYR